VRRISRIVAVAGVALFAVLGARPSAAQLTALSVSKTATPPAVSSGGVAGFLIVVQNLGAPTATGVTLTDTLPAGFTWTESSAFCSISSGVLTCAFPPLTENQQAGVAVSAVTSSANCGVHENTATADAANASPVQDTASLTVQCPDLGYEIWPDAFDAFPGRIGATFAIRNDGDGIARDAVLDLSLHEPGWVVEPADAACDFQEPDLVHCVYGDLPPGEARAVHAFLSSPPCGGHTVGVVVRASNVGTKGAATSIDVFAKGDPNADCISDVLDVFYLINFLFAGGPSPR
jgi:uncharacterized repeat protein (TIGR01451 family)